MHAIASALRFWMGRVFPLMVLVTRLSDKVDAEILRLEQCAKERWEDTASCLGLLMRLAAGRECMSAQPRLCHGPTHRAACPPFLAGLGGLEQAKLYAAMEDQTYVWRSMYVDHLQRWFKVFPAESMLVCTRRASRLVALAPHSLIASWAHHSSRPRRSQPIDTQVVPSESLKEPNSFKAVMERFASLLGLPRAGPEVHNELIFKASPASTDGSVHENGRSYIGEVPPEVRTLEAGASP